MISNSNHEATNIADAPSPVRPVRAHKQSTYCLQQRLASGVLSQVLESLKLCYVQGSTAQQRVPDQRLHCQHQVVHDVQPLQAAPLLTLRHMRQLHPQVRSPLPMGWQLHWRGGITSSHRTCIAQGSQLCLSSGPWTHPHKQVLQLCAMAIVGNSRSSGSGQCHCKQRSLSSC